MGPNVTKVMFDKERTLLYRPGDVADAEQRLNLESWEESFQKRGAQRLIVYLWAGLKATDRNLSIQQVGDLVYKAVQTGRTYADLWNLVADAMVKSGFIRGVEEVSADPTIPLDPPPGSSLG